MATQEKKEDDLGVPFYRTGVNIYLSLKVSKDRGSRKEDVEVLKGMYTDTEKKRNIGYKIWKEAFGGNDKDDNTPGD